MKKSKINSIKEPTISELSKAMHTVALDAKKKALKNSQNIHKDIRKLLKQNELIFGKF